MMLILLGSALSAAIFYAFWLAFPRTSVQLQDVVETNSRAGETSNDTTGPARPKIIRETPLPDSYFKFVCKSHTDINQSGANQKIDAEIELKYTHQKITGGLFLSFLSFELRMFQDGSLVEDTLMTRDKYVQQQGSQKTESALEDLPPDQQEALTAAFTANLLKISLDANQNELGREILSDAGFALINEGNINTVRLMHGPYYIGTNDWKSLRRIPMTHGIIIDCPVIYSRQSAGSDQINVNGSLKKDEIDSDQPGLTLKNVSCDMTGTETFNENENEYTSGKLKIDYNFQVLQSGADPANLSGDLINSLEEVSNKK